MPLDYDPLLAKLIGYGESRGQVIGRLRRALGEYFIAGVKTNLPLFRRILENPDFLAGNTHTGLLDRLPEQATVHGPHLESIVAIAAAIFFGGNVPESPSQKNGDGMSPVSSQWKKLARTEALE